MAFRKILVGDYEPGGDGFHVKWDTGDTMTDPDGNIFVLVDQFTDLLDTPADYTGADGFMVTVDEFGGVPPGRLVFTPVGGVALSSYDATGDIDGITNSYYIPLPNLQYVLGSVHAFVNGKKLLKAQITETPGDRRTVLIVHPDLVTPLVLDPDPTDGETLEFLYMAGT